MPSFVDPLDGGTEFARGVTRSTLRLDGLELRRLGAHEKEAA